MEPERCYEQDGSLFCKNCYSRFFGSYVYDRSSGSMFSSTSSLSRDEDYINSKKEPQMTYIESSMMLTLSIFLTSLKYIRKILLILHDLNILK